MLAQDHEAQEHGAGQHYHADVNCGMEVLVTKQLPRQTEARAGSAAGEIEPFTERAGNRGKNQQCHGDQKIDARDDPGGGAGAGMQ